MLKTLNALLADVEDLQRTDGSDVVKVGSTSKTMIAAFYIEAPKVALHRTLGILLDVERRRKATVSPGLERYTIGYDIICGCSCHDEALEESSIHSDFLKSDGRLVKVITDLLSFRARSSRNTTIGAFEIPMTGKERCQYWIWYNRNFVSKFMSYVILLTEKSPRADSIALKAAPLALRIRCFRCKREAERLGLCEHERAVLKQAEDVSQSDNTDAVVLGRGERLKVHLSGLDEELFQELLEEHYPEEAKSCDEEATLEKKLYHGNLFAVC